jgi:hypothetical protein
MASKRKKKKQGSVIGQVSAKNKKLEGRKISEIRKSNQPYLKRFFWALYRLALVPVTHLAFITNKTLHPYSCYIVSFHLLALLIRQFLQTHSKQKN